VQELMQKGLKELQVLKVRFGSFLAATVVQQGLLERQLRLRASSEVGHKKKKEGEKKKKACEWYEQNGDHRNSYLGCRAL
jgi:hypothetical protein